jgi:energy-coupling factor transporter ATP-binding protein EcfA2
VIERTKLVLDHLKAVKFDVRLGGIAPFGDELPLVTGVAWDTRTAQLAFIAEMGDETDIDQWRQLLFAGSGLRHHLAGDGPAAFGTPVILAIVDDDGEKRLRAMTEDLVRSYALFSRVDLNLVHHRSTRDPEALDDALASLLPRCRRNMGKEISRGEVKRFWAKLDDAVQAAADDLDDIFATFRKDAGRKCAEALIGGDAEAPELAALSPIGSVTLRNFRSFAEQTVTLSHVSIMHGANGSGKTSVLEALELLWAQTSQRRPTGVSVEEYGRHLARDGNGAFQVQSSQNVASSVADSAAAELGRCVLNHETAAALVSRSPDERFAGFLTTTGLEIPDLKTRTANVVAEAKRTADAALAAAGLSSLPRSNCDGHKHLVDELSANFATRLPQSHDLAGLEQTLAAASQGVYQPRSWTDLETAVAPLTRADRLVSSVLIEAPEPELISEALEAAAATVGALIGPRRAAANAGHRLLDALGRQKVTAATVPPVMSSVADVPAPVSVELAVRWLTHGNALAEASKRFRADAEHLTDSVWEARLTGYADALESALRALPRDALEPLTRAKPMPTPSRVPKVIIDEEIYIDAGFTARVEHPETLVASLSALVSHLQREAEVLEKLQVDIERHPARRFSEHADAVLGSLCRFELARVLRREGPITTASEDLVGELLGERLAPIVRELVAAMVRFEWYFKPLLITHEADRVVLGGLSTTQSSLDGRLMLNSAERAVVGLSWFLALHLLQPESRREVLVLDDPAAAFDLTNQAGFISTLRAFVRLTRPKQVVVTSHDDGFASLLADELVPVDQWPSAVSLIRCQRDENDASTAVTEWSDETARVLADEIARLGLTGEPQVVT